MKISSNDFRVPEGDVVSLNKLPTIVDPLYKSKEQYQELLGEHVASLSSLQHLHLRIQPLCHPADLPSDGCGRKRWSHQARDVRRKPARLRSIQLQTPERRGTAT